MKRINSSLFTKQFLPRRLETFANKITELKETFRSYGDKKRNPETVKIDNYIPVCKTEKANGGVLSYREVSTLWVSGQILKKTLPFYDGVDGGGKK